MERLDHILIVDDERDIREPIAHYLRESGLYATTATCSREMYQSLTHHAPDLVVLDSMLPGEDGLALCRELRAGPHRHVPLIMLAARNDDTDRIVGLEMGADDLISKPFNPRELLARVRAVLRRARMVPPGLLVSEAAHLLRFGEWRLDTAARHLIDADDTVIELSGAEYRLLRVFVDHPQRVLTRDQLLTLTHGRRLDPTDRSIDLLVSRIRQRLQDGAREPRYIKTLRNEGYVFSSVVTVVAPRLESVVAMPVRNYASIAA